MNRLQKMCVSLAVIAVIAVFAGMIHAGRKIQGQADNAPETEDIVTEKEAEVAVSGSEDQEEHGADLPSEMEEMPGKVAVRVEQIEASRTARGEITVNWSAIDGVPVEAYLVMRRTVAGSESGGGWEMVAEVRTEEAGEEKSYSITDQVEAAEPQQYEYRVDVKLLDKEHFDSEEGETVLASNLLICIDPGHFGVESQIVDAETYGYAESTAVLCLGLKLREVLKEQYGIDSYLTRETDDITIRGYTNEVLDSQKIALRGEYAAGSDFFISLHTNANAEDANGCPTFEQPVAINKTIILANRVAYTSPAALALCNAVGEEVTGVNLRMGLSAVDSFRTVDTGAVAEWTVEYNDSLEEEGTVCRRLGSKGDYYGVLRGATSVGVPGIIIEHGFHSASDVRRAAMEGDLLEEWAKADARGIARGFGF